MSETLFSIKFDYMPNLKNTFWYRFQLNDGEKHQVDRVSSLFNVVMPVQIRSATAGYTHTFSNTLVNQFNPGISYRSAISNAQHPSEAHAAMPIQYNASPFSPIGSGQFGFPNGTATTLWQLN